LSRERTATVVVPTRRAGARLERLLASLAASGEAAEVIVVDNASGDPRLASLRNLHPDLEVLTLGSNAGYSRAVNEAARRAGGDVLVLLNDDLVVEPGYIDAIRARLDPSAGVVMAAGVMCESGDPGRIDSAGIEIDHALMIFDYLNGEPVSVLEGGVPDPIGPSGGAAAFHRDAFLSVGGFDEQLFAYWEDADLALRLHAAGGRCRLAPNARCLHEHSATLGSGSARKNYLMGFGRGYVLRKWSGASARRLAAIAFRDAVICAGQAVFDRNLAGVRGRFDGYRAATRTHPYPQAAIDASAAPGALGTLARRARRRARLRRRS
jgi:GT2 family glycosyltransferase